MTARRRKSRKPSAASSNARRRVVTLFLDECLGTVLVPEALRRAGAVVICHRERFERGTPDAVWLAALGPEDLVVLTKDTRIQRREIEIQALLSSGLRVFALTGGNLSGEDQAQAFVRALRRIYRFCEMRGPFVARVSPTGRVTLLAGRRRMQRLRTKKRRDPDEP